MNVVSLWQWGNPYYVPGNPYNWRTWLRCHLPWPFWSWVRKGWDCEARGSKHRWYNVDNATSGCYHCNVVRPGRLWEEQRL